MAFGGALPEALHEGFSTAMGQSILLPAAVILLGAAVALFFAKPQPLQGWGTAPAAPARQPQRADRAGSASRADAHAGIRISPAARWSGCRRRRSPGSGRWPGTPCC